MFVDVNARSVLIHNTIFQQRASRIVRSFMELNEPPAFTIRSALVIQYGTSTWVPEIKNVNNIDFVGLFKWDRHFVHFSTGHALDFRGHSRKDANTEFFDKLLRAQKKASVEAVTAALNEGESEQHAEEEDQPAKRRKKKPQTYPMKVLLESEMVGPAIVEINVDGHRMNVLCKLGKSNSLWVEINEENMNFIRRGTRESIHRPGRSRGRAQGSVDGQLRDVDHADVHIDQGDNSPNDLAE